MNLRWLLFLLSVALGCYTIAGSGQSSGSAVWQNTTLTTAAQCLHPKGVAVNSVTGMVYATCDNGVIALNGTSVQTLATSQQCPGNFGVAVNMNSVISMVYAACGGGGVIALNGTSVQTLATPQQCPLPWGVAVNSVTGMVYAANYTGGGVLALDGKSVQTLATSAQCPFARGLAVNSVTGTVYASCSDSVIALNGMNLKIMGGCPYANGLAVNSVTGMVYAACVNGGVIALNGTSVQSLTTSAQCRSPMNVAVNSVSGMVYATCYYGGVIALNGTSVQTLATAAQCPNPEGVAVNSVTGMVYATCQYGGVISLHSAASHSLDEFVLSSISSIGLTQPVSMVATILPTNVTGFLIWYADGVIITNCARTALVSGTSVCNTSSLPLGNLTISAFYLGDDFYLYGSWSSPFYLLVGFCLSPPMLIDGQDQTVGSRPCATQSYPLPTTANCTVGCLPSYFGETVPFTCTNGVWVGSGLTCQLLFSVSPALPLSLPASTSSNVLAIRPASPPTFAAATLNLSCTGAGLITGFPMMFPVNSTASQFWTYTSPPTSIVSPVVCTFTSVGGNASLFMAPPPQSVAIITYCNVCPPGQQNGTDPATNLPICVKCPAGSASPTGVTCRPCEAGTATNSTGQAYCSPCVVGKFQSSPGAITCLSCSTGKVATSSGATTCNSCPPGWTPAADSTSCIPCVPGTYLNSTDSSCMDCPLGRFSNMAATTACTSCTSGKYTTTTGSSYCISCPPGQTNSTETGTDVAICIPCPLGSYSTGGSCLPCPIGHAASSVGSLTCLPCSPGTYLNSTNSTCLPCAVGTYSSSSAVTACQLCAVGKIATTIGAAFCTACTPGQSSQTDPVTGMGACVDCQSGYASPGGAPCLPCLPGYYTNSTGSYTCAACAPGSASNETGLATDGCPTCPTGKVATSSGATACNACPPGSTPADSSVSCVPCVPGTYFDPIQLFCIPCGVGRFSPNSSALSCVDCPVGQVAANAGQSFCSPCKPGESTITDPNTGYLICSPCPPGFASSNGEPCLPCQPGSYSSKSGTFACTSCSQGTASNVSGLIANSCPPCPPGTYQSESASTSCMTCAEQRYSSGLGSISCEPCSNQVNANHTDCTIFTCPSNHFYNTLTSICDPCPLGSGSDGSLCLVCVPGYYTPESGAACTSCQGIDGLVCSGGLASVASGYWAYMVDGVDGDGRAVRTFQTAPCPTGFCPGSPLQQTPATNATANPSSLASIQFCTAPRLNSQSNMLCGECEDGYIPWSNQCVPCTGSNGGLIFVGVVLSFLLVLFLLRASGQISGGGLTVLLFFAQTSTLEIGSVAQWLRWIHVFNFGPQSSSACLAPLNPYDQMLFSLFIPIILMGEVGLLSVLHYALHRRQPALVVEETLTSNPASIVPATMPSSTHSNHLVSFSHHAVTHLVQSFSWSKYIGCMMSVLLFCYTQVASTIFEYLYCIDVASERIVFTAPTIDCHSTQYHAYLVPAILALILYIIGFPVAILVLLWVHKETLFAASVASHSASDMKITLSGFFLRWSPLFQMFHPRAWFWQPIILLRRSMFVLVSVLLVQQPAIRFMSFTFLNFGSLLCHSLVRPFDSESLNHLETGSYVVLVCISILLTGYLPPYTNLVQALLLLAIVIPITGLIIYILVQEWREYQQLKADNSTVTSEITSIKKEVELVARKDSFNDIVGVTVDPDPQLTMDMGEIDPPHRPRASSVVQPSTDTLIHSHAPSSSDQFVQL